MKKISPKSQKKQVKKNGPKKYDWEALRLEFLVSPMMNISEWRRRKRGGIEVPKNWNFQKQTKWRVEEKKKLREEISKEALEQIKKEWVEVYKPDMRELSEAHKKIFTLIQATINGMMSELDSDEGFFVNIKTLKSLREMIKIEKWEPTKYEKTDQILNHSFTSIEILDAEWEEASTKTDKKTKRTPKSIQ